MRQISDNICKFVSAGGEEQLKTVNFVLERNATETGIRHISSYDKMYIVISGSGRLVTERLGRDLEKGTLFFTFAGVPFTLEDTGEIVFMYISYSGRRTSLLYGKFGISEDNCVFPGYSGLISFWNTAISRANTQNLELISESVLLYSFSQMTQPNMNEKEHLVNDIQHIIETKFTDSSLSLEACANELGYNSKYISRIFRQSTGITFSEYLKNVRVKHAIFLIEQGILMVKNLAFLSGYSDPMYFSNVFRKTTGMTPSEYITKSGAEGNDQK